MSRNTTATDAPMARARRRGGVPDANRQAISPTVASATVMFPARPKSCDAEATEGCDQIGGPLPGQTARQPEIEPSACGGSLGRVPIPFALKLSYSVIPAAPEMLGL